MFLSNAWFRWLQLEKCQTPLSSKLAFALYEIDKQNKISLSLKCLATAIASSSAHNFQFEPVWRKVLLPTHQTGRAQGQPGLVWFRVSKLNWIYKEKVLPKIVYLIKLCLPEKWKWSEGARGLLSMLSEFKTHLLHIQISLSSIGRWLQGDIAGGSVRKCSWPSQCVPGVHRAAAGKGQGCHVWKDALHERPAMVGGTAVAVTSRRLQQCSSVQRSHWCGSWHHIWADCCTAIISPQAFCTLNSQNFSWCWTKNTLFPWSCSPSLRFVYPTAAMAKHSEESTTWSLGACSRWTL